MDGGMEGCCEWKGGMEESGGMRMEESCGMCGDEERGTEGWWRDEDLGRWREGSERMLTEMEG